MAFLQPMLTALFGEVKAYGFSLASDGPQSQLELVSGILVKGDRTGVLALPDPSVAAAPPPSFAPGDAVGYGRIQVQFRDIMKLLETAVSNLPEEMASGFEPTLQQYGPDLRKAFDALGPEVHVVSRTVKKPGESPEDEGVYAVTCRDERAVTGLMNLFLPEAGFQPRDFNGNTIFSDSDGEVSMGFGGGMFYMGTNATVEQCLRGGGGNGLAETPPCRQALAAVGSEPLLGWGYTDLVGALEARREALVAAAARSERRMLPKEQREIADRVGIDVPDGLADGLKELDAKTLGEGFGPMQWDMRPVRDGLLTRLRLLRPAKAD
jgi:hypothetical protein